jgi:CheY-like chemotaxis protein
MAGGGSGLGLFITRAIVDKHEGSVGFESEGLGHGCNFFFNIPVFQQEGCQHPASHAALATSSPSFDETSLPSPVAGRSILICDDSDLTRKMLKKVLLGMGCKHCYEAKNGLEAVQMTEARLQGAEGGADGGDEASTGAAVFDFILMDDHMPVLDGPTATHRIRALGFINPIIGVTGNLASEDVGNFIACGANAVLSKPLDMEKMIHVLHLHA